MNIILIILIILSILNFLLLICAAVWILENQKELFKVRRDITIIKNIFRSEINDM